MRCPSYLPAKARTAFKKLREILTRMKVLTEADEHALIMLADAWNDYRDAQRILANEGSTYDSWTEGGAPMKRKHPMVSIRNDAWRRVQSMMSEFGLTPASRTNVSSALKQAESEGSSKKAKSW